MTLDFVCLRAVRRMFACGAVCCALAGCTVGPHYHRASAPVPGAPDYKESPDNFPSDNGWKVAQPRDAMLHGNWWEIFNEPELNDLEAQLNINNQNIKQALENYLAARAQIREAHASYYPTASVSPGFTRSRSPSSTGQSEGVPTNTGNGSQLSELNAPLDISWAPDLFGRVRNTVREYQAAAQVSAADLESEKLLEQATLAETYFEIRGQDELQRVLNEVVAADSGVLKTTQALYETGIDTQISFLQAQQELATAQAQATSVGVARAQDEHAIATLLGKAATDFTIPVRPFTTAPPAIPTGTPSQLLERRPDIAAAERQMAEANAIIGVGKAAYYPTLTLSADGGFQSSSLTDWFLLPSRFWSIGSSLSETVFDAGLRRATVDQYIATYNADVASYRQTVLTAFQQVEDYLAQTRILSQQIQQEQEAVNAATKAFDLEKARYDTGLDPYLTLLTTQTAMLNTQQTLVESQVQQMTGAVLLIEALGGGWDASQLPAAKQVSQNTPASDRKMTQ
jgi:NodT family efflux transporter outer membrane factor (OMF) lipoprotein